MGKVARICSGDILIFYLILKEKRYCPNLFCYCSTRWAWMWCGE